jgi:hypothetical protein
MNDELIFRHCGNTCTQRNEYMREQHRVPVQKKPKRIFVTKTDAKPVLPNRQ